jgi:arylsulfatase A-like enzyme
MCEETNRILKLAIVGICWPFVVWAAQPPNILLIVAEDLSPRIGAFGDPVAQTPALDALAEQGVRYDHVFTASGVCAPSRSALITGVYPQSMGTHQMRTTNMDYQAVPPPEVKAFPELLRRAGYAAANSMKKDYQFGEPFTIWDQDIGDYTTPADLAVWRSLPREKPFFAMITLMDTHESRLVGPDTVGTGNWQGFVAGLRKFRAANMQAVTNPDEVRIPPYYPDTPGVRASLAQHYDNIHFIDKQVGQILANLEADGLADDTVVIWTTDHGDGLPRAKRSVYDSGLRVPLIMRFADGRGAGTANPRLVSFVDLAPTILNLAGAGVPDFVQGQDFLRPAAQAPNPARQYVFAARDRMDLVPDRVRAVRDQRYKYIRNYMPEIPYFRPLTFRDMFPVMQALWQAHRAGTLNPVQAFYFSAPRPREELYDTIVDPHEIENLAGRAEYDAILERLRGALDGWLGTVGDRGDRPEAEMIEAMWPGGRQPLTAAPRVSITAGLATLTCDTPGSSIGYRLRGAAATGPWLLYTAPVALPQGIELEAKAIRYGFAPSAVTTYP